MSVGAAAEVTETLLGVSAAFDGDHLVPGDVAIRGGRIARLGVGAGTGDRIAAPGFVDLQVNGFAGIDLQTAEPEAIAEMGLSLAAAGVTAYQPTIITDTPERMAAALARLTDVPPLPGAARLLPAHLEGPFLSPVRKGAHPKAAIVDPDQGLLRELLGAGAVGYVTLAPERPGAVAMIEELRGRGIVVSLGHSNASAEEAEVGFAAGVTALTHALNAMRPFEPRDPGPVAAALRRGDIWVTAIADGVHLHPTTLDLLRRAAGPRFILVSDAMLAAGLPDGSYTFGSLAVTLRDGRALLKDGQLAGSAAGMETGLRQLDALEVPLEQSLAALTSRPASVIGETKLGRLRPGGRADIVVLDGELRPLTTYVDGICAALAASASSAQHPYQQEESRG